MSHVIFWDFDGTLAWRSGLWSGCLVETLDAHEPGHRVAREHLYPFLQDTFPWHRHEIVHPELGEPEAWWAHVEAILARALEGVGYPPDRAAALAAQAHRHYLDIPGWHLFEDTLPVLERLGSSGWRHVILSNHVPELPAIVAGLGLGPLVDSVVTSAATGFEKPNPQAFAAGLHVAGNVERVWMVGDNPEADIRGAEASGIPSILVRRTAEGIRWQSPDLWGVIPIVSEPMTAAHR
jgi:putative hydrolase of the HAD superfamily